MTSAWQGRMWERKQGWIIRQQIRHRHVKDPPKTTTNDMAVLFVLLTGLWGPLLEVNESQSNNHKETRNDYRETQKDHKLEEFVVVCSHFVPLCSHYVSFESL